MLFILLFSQTQSRDALGIFYEVDRNSPTEELHTVASVSGHFPKRSELFF